MKNLMLDIIDLLLFDNEIKGIEIDPKIIDKIKNRDNEFPKIDLKGYSLECVHTEEKSPTLIFLLKISQSNKDKRLYIEDGLYALKKIIEDGRFNRYRREIIVIRLDHMNEPTCTELCAFRDYSDTFSLKMKDTSLGSNWYEYFELFK